MLLYRLTTSKHSDDLTGTGSKLYGGRWNSVGNAIIYCSENRSLALLEYLVNIPFKNINFDLILLKISFPDSRRIEEINLKNLHQDWNLFPSPLELKKIGDEWTHKNNSLLLKVPSVIVPKEFNYLINPLHKEIKKVRIIEKEDIKIDKRLLKSL
jgi:RES domain-containing protein